MNKRLKDVVEFNEAFNLPINEKPVLGTYKDAYLRYDLMQEELDEYKEAINIGHHRNEDKGIVEIADALTDMMYVLNGMFIYHGLHDKFNDLWNEIHSSNMSKLENGKPIYREDGKVMKGSDYFKPNLKSILGHE